MQTSLIITTYNWPQALDLVLQSVMHQSVLPDEVIIADDGSVNSTKVVIDRHREHFPVRLDGAGVCHRVCDSPGATSLVVRSISYWPIQGRCLYQPYSRFFTPPLVHDFGRVLKCHESDGDRIGVRWRMVGESIFQGLKDNHMKSHGLAQTILGV